MSPSVRTLDRAFRIAARCEEGTELAHSADPADDLDRVLDRFEGALKRGHAEEVMRLTERALETLEVQLNDLEDPTDSLCMVIDRVEELHHKACKKARPDPEALAQWLLAWKHRSKFNFFHDAPKPYADVLGKKGLAAFATLAAASTPVAGEGRT